MKRWMIKAIGFVIILYSLYVLIGKQIVMPIMGNTAVGTVAGFKAKGYNRTPVPRSYDKIWQARTAYVRFIPQDASDSITILSDGNVFVSLLNYHQFQTVKVAYWKGKPQTASIINWREYPMLLFILLVGVILVFGKYS